MNHAHRLSMLEKLIGLVSSGPVPLDPRIAEAALLVADATPATPGHDLRLGPDPNVEAAAHAVVERLSGLPDDQLDAAYREIRAEHGIPEDGPPPPPSGLPEWVTRPTKN